MVLDLWVNICVSEMKYKRLLRNHKNLSKPFFKNNNKVRNRMTMAVFIDSNVGVMVNAEITRYTKTKDWLKSLLELCSSIIISK